MRRMIFAILANLTLCGSAGAQGCGSSNPNCIVPDRPAGDSTGSAANTRFVTNALGNLALPQNDIFVGNASGVAAGVPMSGDCAIITSGAITCTKLNGVSPGPFFNGTSWSSLTGTPTTLAGYGITNAFPTASSTTTYWVNANSGATAACGPTGASTCSAGNDSNNGLSAGAALLTLQHAISLGINSLWQGGNGVTINLAHNAGSANYSASCYQSLPGFTVVDVEGDGSSPTAVVMQAATGGIASVLSVKDGCTLSIHNVKMIDNGSNNASNFMNIGTGGPGHIDAQVITFGALAIGTAISVSYAGTITLVGSNSVIGSENAFISVAQGGVVDLSSATVAGSASITWGTAAAIIQSGGIITGATGSTFTGFSSVNGPRCFMSTLPSPDLADPNTIFPGSSNCVVSYYVGALGLQPSSPGSITYGTAGAPLITGGSSTALDKWGLNTASNTLGADVNLNNTGNYFDGASMAQGSTGTWYASATQTLGSTTTDVIRCKLWDGTTVKASSSVVVTSGAGDMTITLSQQFTSPAGNIRMSCRDVSSTNGRIVANDTANGADSTISGFQIK